MSTYKETLVIAVNEAAGANALLSGRASHDVKDGTVMATYTQMFRNGCVADVNLVSGGKECTPYIDAIIFDNGGCEVYPLEAAAFERIEGEYQWEVDGDVYELTVVAG